MLKLNTVYLYKEKIYLIVTDKVKKNGRYEYRANKVKADGHLGVNFKIKFSKGDFIAVKAPLTVFVNLPKVDRDKIRYENVIDSALKVVAEYKKFKKRAERKITFQRDIGRMAWASTSIYNVKKGRLYDLRDFAKALGFKKYKTLYTWVEGYLRTQFVEDKYKFINKTATSTLKECLLGYQKNWKAIYGFDKNLDKLIKRDFLAYQSELGKRGEMLHD